MENKVKIMKINQELNGKERENHDNKSRRVKWKIKVKS